MTKNTLLELKELEYQFPAEAAELFQGIYYNSFALFVIASYVDEGELQKSWPELEAFVAGYLQNDKVLLAEKLGDLDLIWDIYLVLLCDFKPALEVKMRIENDRFCCKKVILPFDQEKSLFEHIQGLTLFYNYADCQQFLSRPDDSHFIFKLKQRINDDDINSLLDSTDFKEFREGKFRQIVEEWLLKAGELDVPY